MVKRLIGTLLAVLLVATACSKDAGFEMGISGADSASRSSSERAYSMPSRRVMVMISAGYNSLSGYLSEDLKDLESGYLPEGTYFNADVLLVLARLPKSAGDYASPSAPVLYRLWANRSGEVQRDTIQIWGGDTQLCTRETIHEALSTTQKKYPAQSYGVVFSSHGSGWLPPGYYTDPSKFEPSSGSLWSLRSIGQDKTPTGGTEMSLEDFADAIPMHLDYCLIDACLSGCVEVAHALKGKADIVGFSPTEVLADGFDYKNITTHLFARPLDPVEVCREYFAYYNAQSGSSRSATITAVDTRKMDALEAVCKELFEAYRPILKTMSGSNVQGYFRFDRHYFYDLRDILVQAGISEQEKARLDAALSQFIVYQAATDYFLSIPLKRVCGLSMYLPSMGSTYMNKYYKENISWNQATELVL
ncbi:MAG: clostripain-related cysteine peptidase [Candidatus Cryptobacteroides sp.]|nr:clostripain-related cysteine peptidase [Candidatus Cryptobacteroides sp.]MEE3465208.1 clostripain-related cysteine peptidase [Candidatus Cryptobacteroides sp.]